MAAWADSAVPGTMPASITPAKTAAGKADLGMEKEGIFKGYLLGERGRGDSAAQQPAV